MAPGTVAPVQTGVSNSTVLIPQCCDSHVTPQTQNVPFTLRANLQRTWATTGSDVQVTSQVASTRAWSVAFQGLCGIQQRRCVVHDSSAGDVSNPIGLQLYIHVGWSLPGQVYYNRPTTHCQVESSIGLYALLFTSDSIRSLYPEHPSGQQQLRTCRKTSRWLLLYRQTCIAKYS